MTTRRSVVTAAVAAPLLAATGCGARSAREQPFSRRADGSIKIYGWQVTDEVGQARQDYAVRQVPGVHISYDQANFDPQKFTTLLASGKVPDLIVMDRRYVGTYAAKGLIRSLDEGFALSGFKPRDHYYPATLEDVAYQGKVYGIPQFFQPHAIMVNKRVMERSGVSLDDLDLSRSDRFLDAVRKMYRERHGKPRTLGLYPAIGETMPDFLLAFGGQFMDSSGKPTLDHPNNVRALRFLKSLYDVQGGYASVESYFQSFDQFGNGNQYVRDQVGAEVYAQWYPNVLTATKDKVSIAVVPLRDRKGAPLCVSSGTAFVVPKTAANPTAACRWALGTTSDAGWMAAATARMKTVRSAHSIFTGLLTGSRSADDAIRRRYLRPSGNKDFDQVDNAYYDVVKHSRSMGTSAAGLAIRREMDNAVAQICTGKQSPEAGLHDAQRAALYGYDQE